MRFKKFNKNFKFNKNNCKKFKTIFVKILNKALNF